MLEVDLHTHSFFSQCGIHTHIEILTKAKELGMKAVAITDHGPMLKPKMPGPFFDRLKNPVDGIEMLKGMETNVKNEEGDIDIPDKYIKYLDIVLCGIHFVSPADKSKNENTDMLISAIEKNRCIDIISHPNDPEFPVEYRTLAEAAKEYGAALELNNSKIMHKRAEIGSALELVKTCRDVGCRMAVNSDMHAIGELGRDEEVRHIVKEAGFPEELIVNNSFKSAMEFIEERRKNKRC